MLAELIIYATPKRILAAQLDRYFVLSAERYGRNTAHRYMPHVTLTGFFHDDEATINWYCTKLAAAHQAAQQVRPDPTMQITDCVFREDFHGLLVVAPWVRNLVADFASRAADSPSRQDAIRLKDGLHLSLAYGFPEHQHEGLATLGRECVDPTAAVSWQLCLYQRHAGDQWVLHWDTAL
jgi:hypothetical protein